MAKQIWTRDPSSLPVPTKPSGTTAQLNKLFGFDDFGKAHRFAYNPSTRLGTSRFRNKHTIKKQNVMQDWLKKNAPVGGYKTDYSRDPEGKWLMRRMWEGKANPNAPVGEKTLQTLGGLWGMGAKTTSMPATWDPKASQFPWQVRQGVSSDASRHAAFNLGINPGRGPTSMARTRGQTFDPRIDFENAPSMIVGMKSPRYGNRTTQFKQIGRGSYTPVLPSKSGVSNKRLDWLDRMRTTQKLRRAQRR